MFAAALDRLRALMMGPQASFREGLVAVAALVGIPVSWASAIINLVLGGTAQSVAVNLLAGFAILGLFWFARSTGRYQLTYVIAAGTLFVVLFPWLFFSSGGFNSGMPVFFLFAIAFSAVILEGVLLWVLVPLEMVVFGVCFWVAYAFPATVTPLASAQSAAIDTVFAVVATGTALVISVRLLVRLYARSQRQLERRNAELADVDAAKTEFLAMVAHELNTPLTVIGAHADEAGRRLAAADGTDPQAIRDLQVIEDETARLGGLVSQLLDLARISDGGLSLQLGEYHLDTIVQQTLQAYRPVWGQYGNTVEVRRASAAPLVLVDRERVVQVLVNLLSNAARHTSDGLITVGVEVAGDFAELSVADTGVGIDPDVLDGLGSHPVRGRGQGVRSARDSGLGVGLMITRHIVTAHGGRLRIDSVPGQGTTVACTFPLVREAQRDGGSNRT